MCNGVGTENKAHLNFLSNIITSLCVEIFLNIVNRQSHYGLNLTHL